LEFFFCDAEFFAVMEGFEIAGASEAVAFVPGNEFGADADHGNVDVGAAVVAGVVVGGGEKLFADAGVLLGGRNAEEAEVEAVALFLEIYAALDGVVAAGVFEDGGAGIVEQFFEVFGVCAGA